jgi:hypothetical protein
MYTYFAPGEGAPSPDVVAADFMSLLMSEINNPDLADIFVKQALRPFSKAMYDYRQRGPDEDAEISDDNPFVKSMFTKVNGLSVWDMLLFYRYYGNVRRLLAVMLVWGFDDNDVGGWTREQSNKLWNEFAPDDPDLQKARDL